MKSLKTFHVIKELSKSGIVTLVLISVFAGYLIGQPSELPLNPQRMLLTLLGILLIASGSSALNQYQERDIDAKMPRTAGRPLPSGKVSPQFVLGFVTFSVSAGLWILFSLSLDLFLLGCLAVFSYNVLYTLWWKKHWAFAAVPGAIPGALPILMGHVAATQKILHPGGIYLFFILFFWQMPHFWALALRYQQDYEKGGFPTLPVKHGQGITVRQIITWCIAYLSLALMAPFFIPVGWIYLVPTLIMSIQVVRELIGFSRNPNSKLWLRFFLWINFSLIIYLMAATLDLWSIYLPIPHLTR